jgi:osmotically-inducible protein OsmY
MPGFSWHEIGLSAGMKLPLLCLTVALGFYACSREEPAVGQPRQQTSIDETRQVERAADAGKPLSGPPSGEAPRPLSDASLTQIVRSALESESSLDARKIDVENRSGTVALHGTVENDEQREKAGRIVGAVGGVRAVQNNLAVEGGAAAGGTARKD